MTDRVIDIAFYLAQRAWTICATLTVIAFIGAAGAFLAPPGHPELIVIAIP